MKRIMIVVAFLMAPAAAIPALAHPMGNFSINHYSHLNVSPGLIRVVYGLDFAEIPTFQLLSEWTLNSPGISQTDIETRVAAVSHTWTSGLKLSLNDVAATLRLKSTRAVVLPGAGNLRTMKVFFELESGFTGAVEKIDFHDQNYREHLGWKEIVVEGGPGIVFPDGNGYQVDRSGGLTRYPEELLSSAPSVDHVVLRVRAGRATQTRAALPGGAARVSPGDLRPGDRLSTILGRQEIPLSVALLALGLAFFLGGIHALSPGHGKTIVAAYLVGNRGTGKHAMLLGAIVTLTHTIGVFALGLVTLFASQYIVPERLYPLLGFGSGGVIFIIGISLVWRRLAGLPIQHTHDGFGEHSHAAKGGSHGHEIPDRITFRNLVGLGVSGGIVPCPSALVVLLSAVALHRIGLGLLLIVAFSAGLATVLIAMGLAAIYAKTILSRFAGQSELVNYLPAASALLISLFGLALAVESLSGTSYAIEVPALLNGQALAILGLGLVLGLKHATDADHIVAVSTFVSEGHGLLKSCWIGLFWGIGHTLSLAAAGVVVILLKISIPERIAAGLEFGVAVMLVLLGIRVIVRALYKKTTNPSPLSNHSHWYVDSFHMGLRPLVVGIVHGAAGGAALMLLVLSTIRSPFEAFLYILIFGVGSIVGMLLISVLISIPLHWAGRRVVPGYQPVELLAGVFSALFGLCLGLEIWRNLPS